MPGSRSAAARAKSAPESASVLRTPQSPSRPTIHAAADPCAPTATCGSAGLELMMRASSKRRSPARRAAACMPASSLQMTTAVPFESIATSALGSASSLPVSVCARPKALCGPRAAMRKPKE